MDYTVREAAIEDLDMLVSFVAEMPWKRKSVGKLDKLICGKRRYICMNHRTSFNNPVFIGILSRIMISFLSERE